MSLPILLLIGLLPLNTFYKEAATLYLEDGSSINCTVQTDWEGVYTNSASVNKIKYWIDGKKFKIDKTKVKEVKISDAIYHKLKVRDKSIVYSEVNLMIFAEKVVTGTSALYEHFYTTSPPPKMHQGATYFGDPILASTYYLETSSGIEEISPEYQDYKNKIMERFGGCEALVNKIQNQTFQKSKLNVVIEFVNQQCQNN